MLPKEKVNIQEMLKFEERANENSQKLIKEVLNKLNFKNEEINTVTRLIEAADKHLSEQNDAEIIVDADNLSKLCVEHVQEKYKQEAYKDIIDLWERKFPERIKTKKGKDVYPDLLEKLKQNLL